MKTSGTCPKCACRKLYVVDGVRQPAHDSNNVIHKMSVTTAAIPTESLGLPEDNIHRSAIGSFEAWICSSCGLTEWYAKDFQDAFARLVNMHRRVHVRLEEREAADPYR